MIVPEALKSFGVVCHDAGAAGQIAAMVKAANLRPAWVMAEGPAVAVWRHYFPGQHIAADFAEMRKVNKVVTGTSLKSDLEHQARLAAQKTGLRSVTVLDHWVNYENRFIRYGCRVMPDEIWVVDEYAEVLAREAFPGTMVIRFQDYYAKDQLAKLMV